MEERGNCIRPPCDWENKLNARGEQRSFTFLNPMETLKDTVKNFWEKKRKKIKIRQCHIVQGICWHSLFKLYPFTVNIFVFIYTYIFLPNKYYSKRETHFPQRSCRVCFQSLCVIKFAFQNQTLPADSVIGGW